MSTLWTITKRIGKTFGIISVPIAFFECIGHPASVVGASMEPTLKGNDARWWMNDIIWLSKIHRFPKNGEIYTYISPRDPKVHHVKRVTAIPGEIIDVRNRPPMPLGPLEYWMSSDNVTVGQDSRNYGPVNMGLFQGKVMFILWPPSRFGSLY
uniref:Mitochondrial inner membrane protease subunit 2 n=1 Tax=Panagrolaimus sp. ES5 TaxID=591445 RepID=A0AC34FS96_9BILA